MATIFPTYPGPWFDRTVSQSFLSALAAGERLAIPTEIDRLQLVAWLTKHELAALACQQLDKQEAIANQLTASYWDNASANELKLAFLETLLGAFAEAGIKCILLKGVAFCLTIYPDTAVRPMSDLDIWVQRHDWPLVWQVMHSLGYETDKLWRDPYTVANHVTTLEFYPRQAMPQDLLSVEIHSDLIAHPTHLIGRLPLTEWWERAYTQEWRSHTVHLLDPAAALLHTAVHQMFQHHGQIRLRWLLDVDQLIRGTPHYQLTHEDWQLLTNEATQAGVLPALQAVLQLVQTWFRTPLPEPALALLNCQSDTEQQAFFQGIAIPHQSKAAVVWTDLQGISSIRQRLLFFSQKIVPSPRYMMKRYHISSPLLLPFYYIFRCLKGIYMTLRQQ